MIAARIDGTITERDDERLRAWLAASDENRRMFEDLLSDQNLELRIGEYERLDLGDLKARIMGRIVATKPRRTHLRRFSCIAAAGAAILLAVLSYLILRDGGTSEIVPGRKIVMLETSDGRTFDLDAACDTIIESGTGTLRNGSEGLEYLTENAGNADMRYDRIIVPRGGEYKITLPDGSRVWLNSGSELRYAASNRQEVREVVLSGEAYFEVTASEKPFVVNTRDASVRVLGTSFNVSAYPDEAYMSATLAEGRVEVLSGRTQQSVILAPGDQANVLQSGAIEIRQVDPELYIGWKDELFIFNNEDFGTIMRKLSRWYDVEIVFEDEALSGEVFYGIMQKYGNVTTILDMIGKSYPIDYRITKNRITIKRKE